MFEDTRFVEDLFMEIQVPRKECHGQSVTNSTSSVALNMIP